MGKGYEDFIRSMNAKGEDSLEDKVALRPTLYIGLGGFGNAVLQKVKKFILENIPDYQSGYGFIGLDTYQLNPESNLGANQYIPLSVGVDPNFAAKQDPEHLKWYSEVVGYYKAKSIQSGADACKAVGRLAFRFTPTLKSYLTNLDGTTTFLTKPKDGFMTGEPLKVFVISTVAGGTGAGCLLDVLFVTGKFLRDTVGSEFPYQAILVSPEMLKSTPARGRIHEFCSNSFASLAELHHFLMSGKDMVVSYDDKRFRNMTLNSTFLPNHFFFVGAQNEEGNTIVSSPEDLQDIIVSYLVSEIQTPMSVAKGEPRIQDKENIHFGSLGRDGMPRSFSSFGVVRTGYPSDIAESFYAYRVLQALLSAELASPDHSRTFAEADNWLNANKLKEEGSDQLQDLLKGYIQGDYQVRLDAAGMIMQPGFKYEKLSAGCQNFVKEKRKFIEGDRKKAIEVAAKIVTGSIINAFTENIEMEKKRSTIGETLEYLKIMQDSLKGHQKALKDELKQSEARFEILEKEVDASTRRVGESIRGWWGRKSRVTDTVSDFGLRLQAFLNQQIDVWIKEKADEIYSVMVEMAKAKEKELNPVALTLRGRLADVHQRIIEITNTLNKMAKIEGRGEGNRFSLVNSDMVKELYDELVKPGEGAVVAELRKRWLDDQSLLDTKSKFSQWIALIAPSIYGILNEKFAEINFISIIERFFQKDKQQRDLFNNLKVLSTPLFCLDPNTVEDYYDLFWIIGIHPDLKRDFVNTYQNNLGGLGCSYAYFDSKDEIILYQLKIGYTLHSFRLLNGYEMDYRLQMEEFRKGLAKKLQIKPVHCWPEAENWTDLIPRPEAEDALKWFILGRAFNHLFPSEGAASPTDRKNVAFVSARGTNYYLQPSEDKDKAFIGKGLVQAVLNFSERIDWQATVREAVEAKIRAVGDETATKRLKEEYVGILDGEIEATENPADAQIRERRDILLKFKSALKDFIEEDVGRSGV